MLVWIECIDLLRQIKDKTVGIDARTKTALQFAEAVGVALKLQIMSGDEFSACSSDEEERLERTPQAGQVDIRRLLIIGATSWLNV